MLTVIMMLLSIMLSILIVLVVSITAYLTQNETVKMILFIVFLFTSLVFALSVMIFVLADKIIQIGGLL